MTEWKASDYARQSTLQETMAAHVLGLLELKGTERVLDVGCGDGKITARIAGRVPRGSVLGIDPSRDMIAFATRQFAGPDHPNLRFEVGDARRLPDRHEFDLVVSFNALLWVREQDEALRSIHSALEPGGRALLRMVALGDRTSLEHALEDVRSESRWSDHFRDFETPFAHVTPDHYRALALANGFSVNVVRVHDETWDFGTRDAFAAFCRATTVAWTARLPEERRDAFIEEVLDRYRSIAAEHPGEANVFKFYQMDADLTAL